MHVCDIVHVYDEQSGLLNPLESRCLGELVTKLLNPVNKDFERIRGEGYPYSGWHPLLKVSCSNLMLLVLFVRVIICAVSCVPACFS